MLQLTYKIFVEITMGYGKAYGKTLSIITLDCSIGSLDPSIG